MFLVWCFFGTQEIIKNIVELVFQPQGHAYVFTLEQDNATISSLTVQLESYPHQIHPIIYHFHAIHIFEDHTKGVIVQSGRNHFDLFLLYGGPILWESYPLRMLQVWHPLMSLALRRGWDGWVGGWYQMLWGCRDNSVVTFGEDQCEFLFLVMSWFNISQQHRGKELMNIYHMDMHGWEKKKLW
jgi:hypothetical protein